MCPEECHSSFCSSFSPAELLAAASNLSSPTATGPDYPMLKHLPRSCMDFLHIFNLFWTSLSFHEEDIFHYSHSQDGKASPLSCFFSLALTKSCQSCAKASSLLMHGLRIPFLPSGRHLLLFPFTRWQSLSTLLLSFRLSLSPPASQSFLNASFYPVYSSFWNLIPFFFLARPVHAPDGLH